MPRKRVPKLSSPIKSEKMMRQERHDVSMHLALIVAYTALFLIVLLVLVYAFMLYNTNTAPTGESVSMLFGHLASIFSVAFGAK